jgi:hypothetical protein
VLLRRRGGSFFYWSCGLRPDRANVRRVAVEGLEIIGD